MSSRFTRAIAAVCGVLGVVMLTAHFLFPAGVPNSAWLQVTGAVLYVVLTLMPRAYGYTAVLGLENLWLIAVAIALLRTAPGGSHDLRARPLSGVAS